MKKDWEKEFDDLYWYDLQYAGDFSVKDKNFYAKEMAKKLNEKIKQLLKDQRHSIIEEIIEKVLPLITSNDDNIDIFFEMYEEQLIKKLKEYDK